MQDKDNFQIKQTGGHFELWCRHSTSPQWFYVARRSSIRELILLVGCSK